MALDARIRVNMPAPAGANFAIRPYPSQLVQTLDWHGRTMTRGPIRPRTRRSTSSSSSTSTRRTSACASSTAAAASSATSWRTLTQIDYAREMAFVATAPDALGVERTLGVVRAVADPDNVEAEFRHHRAQRDEGRGLGELLMKQIIDYLRRHGTQRLVATVLNENTRMLQLARPQLPRGAHKHSRARAGSSWICSRARAAVNEQTVTPEFPDVEFAGARSTACQARA